MLENFQLAAIVRDGAQTSLLQIPLHQRLQDSLAESWEEQYDAFVEGISEIDFDAGYRPEDHERFCLPDYELPHWIAEEDSQTISTLDEVSRSEALINSVKGIVAFARNNQGRELRLFQNFTRSQVIRPGRFLILRNDTYESAGSLGLTLDGKLSAVYWPAESKLLFRNFRTVNTFLPLSDFHKEASEQEVREILNHKLLAPEDLEALATDASQWFRKRFAMLKSSGVLDQFSAREIQSRSKECGVSVRISNGKIVFPSDKPAAKKLLQVLNEELFLGTITKTLYETNSKRQADK